MPSVTLADLIEHVYGRLDGNTAFYREPEVVAAINEGVTLLNLVTGFISTTGTITTAANQAIYNIPASVLIPQRVAFQGRALNKTSVWRLGHSNPTFLRDTTETTQCAVSDWYPVGVGKVGIFPVDAVGGRTLSVTGVATVTPPMVNDTDSIPYPSEYGDFIEDYAAHVCQFKAGGIISAMAMKAYQGLTGRINDIRRFKAKVAPKYYIELKQENS
jgi:hypothetical protein